MAKQPTVTSSTSLYGGTVQLDFYEQYGRRKHVYCIGDIEIPNVTTILNCLDKPALQQWAVNEMGAYILRSCTPGMVVDEVQFPLLVDTAKSARFTKSDQGKTIGALAHDWIQRWVDAITADRLDLMPDMPVNDQLRAACENFLHWQNSHKIVWLHSEQKLYSRQFHYCGTCDFIAEVDGILTLGDFKTTNVNKTTKSGVYPEHWLQTAAYQAAWQEEAYDGEHGIEQRIIVRLGKEPNAAGEIDFEVKTSREFNRDFDGFLGALSVHKAMAPIVAGEGITTLGLDPALVALTQKAPAAPVRTEAGIAAAEAVAA